MSTITEGLVVSDVVKKELPDRLSRETEVVAASQTLVLGEVVQKNSSDQLVALAAEADEVQTIGITGTLAGGTFTLTFVTKTGATVTTDPIAYDANTAGIQTGVDSALGASMVVVSGTAITGMIFTFSGTGYTKLAQSPIVVNASALTIVGTVSAADEVQTIGITGTLSAGTFTLTFQNIDGDDVTTDPIAYNGDTAAVQAGVDTALGGSKVVVSGTAITGMIFTFSGTGYTNLPWPMIRVATQGLTGEEDINVEETTVGVAAVTAASPEDVTVTETVAGGAGGNDAYGVILSAVTTGGGETEDVACITSEAEVNSDNLIYGSGTAALANAALNVKHIKTTAQVA